MSEAADGFRYYRWAGFLLRHPEGDRDAAEILKRMEWSPAPKEAVIDIAALPEDHPPGGWCTRLSPTEAARMATGFGVSL
ncbi:MAG TPA: hypothetical protein VNT56_06685 [Acidimicrobiales bacterium]|nr:hypothetical protein [Acidimicrobiales bacterium]